MASRTRSRSTLRPRSTERPAKLTKSNPASRSCSPAVGNGRIAKLNLYLSKYVKNSTSSISPSTDPVLASPHTREVKRWDGNSRMTVKWDSVRKDHELWFSNGDCLVHFYERGASRRGASLRVSHADIEASNCGPLLAHCHTNASGPQRITPDSERSAEVLEYFDDLSSPARHELYIPAPSHLTREEALHFHLTTRNFFAWMYERPLVGDCLGHALISLQERMNQYRPKEKEYEDDMLAYVDDQGYTDFRDCPDHALAILQYAERLQLRELWTDAFVHCTGMYDRLDSSGEFGNISRSSLALITRAHIEMDLRLERAGRSLGNFLEDDLSGVYLGLGKEAQLHLERFRSFLHSYYVGQYSYWPPAPAKASTDSFPMLIYRSIYFDFRNLYEYLADRSSGVAIQDNRPLDGGICVFENVMAFNKRNKNTSLPHPLPLVPKVPVALNYRRSFGLLNIFGNKPAKFDRRVSASGALMAATNAHDEQVMNNGLVREYLRFEKLWTMKEEMIVSCADARKVRWILIYAILQTLISVTRVPNEVRDTEGVTYPMCCQIAGTPPWPIHKGHDNKLKVRSPKPTSLKDDNLELPPDMDFLSAKPGPLVVRPKVSRTSSSPQRKSFVEKLSLKSPKPIRTSSIDFLDHNLEHISPIEQEDELPISVGDVSPLDREPCLLPEITITPTEESPLSGLEHFTDPSTPSTSELSGCGGWSASSSEDDMEHASVEGSDSNYGDDEDEEQPSGIAKEHRSRGMALMPPRRSPSGASFGKYNPEVERFLMS
ncbi:MAG: hypothetical protein Q9217_002222 [Psora testacea]